MENKAESNERQTYLVAWSCKSKTCEYGGKEGSKKQVYPPNSVICISDLDINHE